MSYKLLRGGVEGGKERIPMKPFLLSLGMAAIGVLLVMLLLPFVEPKSHDEVRVLKVERLAIEILLTNGER